MFHGLNGPYKAGGISLIISGILFLLKHLLDLLVGQPPSSGAEILAWMASEQLYLALISEVLFLLEVDIQEQLHSTYALIKTWNQYSTILININFNILNNMALGNEMTITNNFFL